MIILLVCYRGLLFNFIISCVLVSVSDLEYAVNMILKGVGPVLSPTTSVTLRNVLKLIFMVLGIKYP